MGLAFYFIDGEKEDEALECLDLGQHGCLHDYDPAWDYKMVGLPHRDVLTVIHTVCEEMAKKVLPQLGIPGVAIFFVEKGCFNNAIAKYVNGTSQFPMIGLDIESIQSVANEGLFNEINLTLAHELGHAYVDSQVSEETHDLPQYCEEEAVEKFAEDWTHYNVVNLSILDKIIADSEFYEMPYPE